MRLGARPWHGQATRLRPWVAAIALAVTMMPPSPARADPANRMEPTTFAGLSGWAEDDHAAAFSVFRRTCARRHKPRPTRMTRSSAAALASICRHAAARPHMSRSGARAFFERHFRPLVVVPQSGQGFLTGYFEPEYPGSLAPSGTMTAPLLARPVGLSPPYPDRAAIEGGALGAAAHALVYLDPVEAFVVHVQGSARIRLPDGRLRRVAFAGRNGHPYTSIAREVSRRENIPPAQLGLTGLMAWLRAHPAEAAGVMQLNASYIFFRRIDSLSTDEGPLGAAGVSLTPGRSLAIDHTIWPYGLPVWLDAGAETPIRRLVVAQDTGAAIRGPARGDLFVGTGEEAGAEAGALRQAVRFVVLWPRSGPAPDRP